MKFRFVLYPSANCSLLTGLLMSFFLLSCSKKTITTAPPVVPPVTGADSLIKEVPAGAPDGVSFQMGGQTAVFNLYAPGKHKVQLIGSFNDWKADNSHLMYNSKDGSRWWIKINNLRPGTRYGYQYLVDDTIKIADPYARTILDPDHDAFIPSSVYPDLMAYPKGKTTGFVGVFTPGATSYNWQVKDFKRPDPQNLVIYELLVRDFIGSHNYTTLKDTLDYIARLGVNAIELMPVNEFEGNDSWGYNTNFLFALDKYYGSPDTYKAFIDGCHARGIAVIQDIVLEDQFGSSPMIHLYQSKTGAPAPDNPWFDQENRHPYAVGYQLNHESAATKYYTKNVLKFWIDEYHIDGYRFDQAKGFTGKVSNDDSQWSAYDPGRVAILTDYLNYVKSLSSDLYVILEYFADQKEETTLAGLGAMVWENLNFNAAQATMGYNDAGGSWDLSGLAYTYNQYTAPAGQVAYVESHDEQRIQFKNTSYGNKSADGTYDVHDLATGLKRDALLAAFFMATPGPKMIWQFGERGYDISIGTGMQRLEPKPPHWEYMQVPERKALYDTYAKMIHLKTRNAVFNTADFAYSLNGAIKSIVLKGIDGTNVVVVGNFGMDSQVATVEFPSAGTWYDMEDGRAFTVGALTQKMTISPGVFHIFSSELLTY